MAVKTAVVMKDIMTLSLPLIFLLMISGESQLLQHHFKMFSVIAHKKKNRLHFIPDIFFASVSLSVTLHVHICLHQVGSHVFRGRGLRERMFG